MTEECRKRVQTAAEPELTEWGLRLLPEGSLERGFATEGETGRRSDRPNHQEAMQQGTKQEGASHDNRAG
ncbi:MAG: hypothetical protein HY814_10640 [Candidatus Riflebacteria bacterium]|nr:hypothetical protein [Candidatus Riflebacteria bacterium]